MQRDGRPPARFRVADPRAHPEPSRRLKRGRAAGAGTGAELRNWLYAGDTPADSDLASDLRDFAAALELDYPARIEVVAVGTSTERASGEIAAAAREAMLNAARHAGGEVSVYIEGSSNAVDVFVRDRGTGFDPDAVPADRLGVKQSIIGRMRRAGGSASVGRGAGGGTEVHLRFETEAGRG